MFKLMGMLALGVAGAAAALLPGTKPIDVPKTLGLTPSFTENFDGGTLDRRRWRTSYGKQGDAKATLAQRSLYGNHENQVYVAPDYLGLGINPFAVRKGALTITAKPLDARAQAAIAADRDKLPPDQRAGPLKDVAYSSGLITTQGRFEQRYGYFEMRARWTLGKGLWPAFWLLPADGSWPPELDIMEAHGDKPTVSFQTKHSKVEKTEPHEISLGGPPTDYHTYGLLWTPQSLRFYIDGRETARTTTPADANKPMYVLANLAVGGSWPGMPNAATHFPAGMDIDWIHAFALPDGWSDEKLAALDR